MEKLYSSFILFFPYQVFKMFMLFLFPKRSMETPIPTPITATPLTLVHACLDIYPFPHPISPNMYCHSPSSSSPSPPCHHHIPSVPSSSSPLPSYCTAPLQLQPLTLILYCPPPAPAPYPLALILYCPPPAPAPYPLALILYYPPPAPPPYSLPSYCTVPLPDSHWLILVHHHRVDNRRKLQF